MPNQVFSHRGFMLDVCRHYMPVADIERILDAAAICGMNRMHWHLTDDQGWRIEIKKYPRLTRVGSNRGPSFFGDFSQTENNCGFYTQDEVREIVAYAKRRDIEIIPEIELPGHASAMLAAYPRLGCRRAVDLDGETRVIDAPYTYAVRNTEGIFPELVCAGKDEAVQFLKDVLDEVVALFPFPMVHIGGDEAPKLLWRRCPDCQRRMREEGIETEDALQRWLVLRIGEYLAEKGRSTIVWNDVLAGGLLPKHFIVQQWHASPEQTGAFLAAGGRVIVSDTDYFYYDYPYGETDVYRIWRAPLTPPYAAGHEAGLLGVECALWTERITNTQRAAWMLFPRMAAVGLRLNGEAPERWEDFAAALRETQAKIDALGLVGAPEEYWHMSPEAAAADREDDHRRHRAPCALPMMDWERRLLRQEALERLLEKIDMPRPFARLAADWALGRVGGYDACVPQDVRGADVLAEQLLTALKNREDGPWKGIEEDVWIDTLKAFTRFVNEHYASYGVYGFDRGYWTTRQAGAKLLRLGQLEYELIEAEDGSPLIGLHIPSDVSLEPDGLNASVARARAFLRERFPEWADAPVRCHSWLLAPALKRLLPPEARILRFQAAFDLTGEDPEDDAVLQWVFGLAEGQKVGAVLEALPEDTTLRRNMKAFLLSGGKVGEGSGVLVRDF